MWSVNQQWQPYSTLQWFRFCSKNLLSLVMNGKIHDGHPDQDWIVFRAIAILIKLSLSDVLQSNWPQRIVCSLCHVIVQCIDHFKNTNHATCSLCNVWQQVDEFSAACLPPPLTHMSGNFVATNLRKENAVLKEAYIKCRCQLLKVNPTLPKSFSETKDKVTAD